MLFPFFRSKHYSHFIKNHPAYRNTHIIDKLRRTEYKRLDKKGYTYLDYAAGSLYADRQIKSHLKLLKTYTFGNVNANSSPSLSATRLVKETRALVLDFFNATDNYYCIFTPNVAEALKMVGEAYPFNEDAFLLLSSDNHNSVNKIGEFAKNAGASYTCSPLQKESLFIEEKKLIQNLDGHQYKRNKLFAFPAQSNASGVKHSLEYVAMAKQRGWDVLLDTASFVSTNKLDLQLVQPDFATVSFYKIFGYPTGLGCLLVKKEMFNKMNKPEHAIGKSSISTASVQTHFFKEDYERFEDGTVSYLDIPAVKEGLKHMHKIGMDTVCSRVQMLTSWLYHKLVELKHNSGTPLLHIFGTTDLSRRGGTLAMHFYNKDGKRYPLIEIEAEANVYKIALRTGCFGNPGVEEVNSELSDGLANENYEMRNENRKFSGSIRISLGIASNFKDVVTFYNFAKGFLNR